MAKDGWVTLICPPGAQDGLISHGDRSFHAYRADHTDPQSHWLVDVPEGEVAYHMTRTGGFVRVSEK
jgi:hypothetical protein